MREARGDTTASLQLRLPRTMLEHLNQEANRNGRSLNSEIAMRLAKTLGGKYEGPHGPSYTPPEERG